jgi:hypothetical protein
MGHCSAVSIARCNERRTTQSSSVVVAAGRKAKALAPGRGRSPAASSRDRPLDPARASPRLLCDNQDSP